MYPSWAGSYNGENNHVLSPISPVKKGYFLGKHSRRSRRVGKRVSPPDTGAISGCSYRRTSISYVWRPINCAHSGELSKCVKSFVYYINSEVLNLHSLLAQHLYAYITVFLIPPNTSTNLDMIIKNLLIKNKISSSCFTFYSFSCVEKYQYEYFFLNCQHRYEI